jgi:hypothetical protein
MNQEVKKSSPTEEDLGRNRRVVLPVPSSFPESDVPETLIPYINKKGIQMNETEKQYDIYLSEIQKYKKRKPDYFITLRAETNEMWRTATIHKWTNLLHDFSDNIVDAFYHDNDKTGEKGKPPACVPIIGCLENTGGLHAHLMLWRDDTKRKMNSNVEMRRRCRTAFGKAIACQPIHARQLDEHRMFDNDKDAKFAGARISRWDKSEPLVGETHPEDDGFKLERIQEEMFGGLENYISKDLWNAGDEPAHFFSNSYANAIVRKGGFYQS